MPPAKVSAGMLWAALRVSETMQAVSDCQQFGVGLDAMARRALLDLGVDLEKLWLRVARTYAALESPGVVDSYSQLRILREALERLEAREHPTEEVTS
jgi:hypothetical protein